MSLSMFQSPGTNDGLQDGGGFSLTRWVQRGARVFNTIATLGRLVTAFCTGSAGGSFDCVTMMRGVETISSGLNASVMVSNVSAEVDSVHRSWTSGSG